MKKFLSFVLSFLLLTSVTVHAAEATAPTGVPLSEIESHIDEIVANYMQQFTPGFAIAVVKDGEIIFSQGYGYADIARQIPVDPAATVFELASLSKMFVFVSVMQLVEQGLLDLDNDIHMYLPAESSRLFNFEKTFTMRDLLNHSAGFSDFDFNVRRVAETVENRTTLREGLLASQPRQIFEPGTATSYSNFGIALAAYIVGHVGGLEYADFERTNILNPLEMHNTRNQPHWFRDSAFLQNKAKGHQPNGSGGFNEFPWYYLSIYPAGALNGTALDLAQFAIALMPPPGEPSPLFSNRDTLDLMLSPSYSDPRILRGTYHGFRTYDSTHLALGHAGGTSGFNTDFVIVPAERFGIVALSNANGGNRFIEEIFELFIGNSRDTAFPPAENLPNARNVAGIYVMLQRNVGNLMEPLNSFLGTDIRVDAIDENTITLTTGGTVVTYRQIEPYVFRAISADTISARIFARTRYEIRFSMENGQPIGVSLRGTNSATIQSLGILDSIFGTVLMLASVIFFLVMPLIIFVKFLRRRGKDSTHFSLLTSGLLACGMLLVVSWIMLSVRMLAAVPFIFTAMVTPHIWLNYILLAVSLVLLVTSLVFLKKGEVATRLKALYISTIVFLVMFVIVLWDGNLLVMM